MQDCGLLADGDSPSAANYLQYIPRLNELINVWQIGGLKLWTQETISVPLVQGTGGPSNPYTLMPSGSVNMTKPMRILDSCFYLDANNNSRPVFLISVDEYNKLSTRIQQGPVTQICVQKLVDRISVNTWLVPDAETATGTLNVLVQKQITNLVTELNTLDFPQEWFIALHWGLAAEICTGQPKSVIDRCEAKAAAYRRALEDWDVEDADTRFAVDSQYLAGQRMQRGR